MKSADTVKKFAIQIRLETLKCLRTRGFGHVGGCMSVVETLAVLYEDVMKYDPKNPEWEERDYLIMSKGHAGPTLFAALALKEFFPLEWMDTLSIPHTKLPSHCDRLRTPGIDVSTGSLGQGLSIGAGLAQGFKILDKPNRVYVILGDGECAEGQIWEAAQYANHYNLGNLIAFIDWNKKQVDGKLEEILDPLDLRAKFEAFGWYTLQVDGSNTMEIGSAIRKAQAEQGDKPTAIILDGIKGSGVPEFEEMEFNHHFAFEPDLINRVIDTLEKKLAEI